MTKSNMKILEDRGKKIKYVAHLADIHIHKRERECEYREVFQNLYNDLKKNQLTNDNSVIVVCGDILHDKVELHPVSVRLVIDFFVMLCEVTTVIVISGNHDVSLYNEDHNSLHSIIGKNMKTTNNLFMLIDEGLYQYNNIVFGHTRFGEKYDIVRCVGYKDKIKCALYHGTINNSVGEGGFVFKNEKDNKKYYSANDFYDYDYVFLGDIHRHSFLKDHIAYPGSLCQQTIDESLNKGYILWDLCKEKGQFRKINNSYGKLKILIDENGKYDIDVKNLPANLDVYIESKSIDRKNIDDVYKQLSINDITIGKKYDEIVVEKKFETTAENANGEKQDLALLKNKNAVAKLLIDFIKKTDKKISALRINGLRKKILDILEKENFIDSEKKKKIRLVNLKFDNMTVFVNDNFIDFQKFKKIVGISEKNSSGKSALIDCILFAIFGECTRGEKEDMINIGAKSCSSEIILDVSDVKYVIKRTLNKNKKNEFGKVSKETITILEDDNDITGSTLPETRNIIKKKIGTIEEFLLSCFVTQKATYQEKVFGFAELTSEGKRNLLCKIARLDIFDVLYKESVSKCNSLSYNLGVHNKEMKKYIEYGDDYKDINNNMNNKKDELEKNISVLKNNMKNNTATKNKLNKEQNEICNKIAVINHEIQKYGGVEDIKIDVVKNKLEKLKIEKSIIDGDIEKYKNDIKIIDEEILEIGDIEYYVNMYNNEKKNNTAILKNELKKKRSEIWNNNLVDYELYDEVEYLKEKKKMEDCVLKIQNQMKEFENEICEYEKLLKHDDEKNNTLFELFNTKKYELKEKENSLIKKQKDKAAYEIKMQNLKNYQYDPKCNFCMKNTMTTEKIFLEDELTKCNDEINQTNKDIVLIKQFILQNEKTVKNYIEMQKKKNDAVMKIEVIKRDINLLTFEKQKKTDEINNAEKIIFNYSKYLLNAEINDDIDELEQQIEEVQNMKCSELLEYEYLTNKKNKYSEIMAKKQSVVDKIVNEIEKNDILIKIYNDHVEETKKYNNNIEKRQTLMNETQKCNGELKKINNCICRDEKSLNLMTRELIELEQNMKSFNGSYDEFKKVQHDKDDYDILKNILKDNLVVNSIMSKNVLPAFSKIINNMLYKFGLRGIDVKYIGKEIIIRDEYNVNTVKDGGYQTFLNNMIYRVALSELNTRVTTKFMIIDEAFDSADNDNKDIIYKLLDYIRNKYDWVMVISHDSDIKEKFEHTISIKHIDVKKKRVQFK